MPWAFQPRARCSWSRFNAPPPGSPQLPASLTLYSSVLFVTEMAAFISMCLLSGWPSVLYLQRVRVTVEELEA